MRCACSEQFPDQLSAAYARLPKLQGLFGVEAADALFSGPLHPCTLQSSGPRTLGPSDPRTLGPSDPRTLPYLFYIVRLTYLRFDRGDYVIAVEWFNRAAGGGPLTYN